MSSHVVFHGGLLDDRITRLRHERDLRALARLALQREPDGADPRVPPGVEAVLLEPGGRRRSLAAA